MNTKVKILVLVVTLGLYFAPTASAHCDSMSGPVVQAARLALNGGDITPLLKWVKPQYEPELRAAFTSAVAAHRQGGAAGELAERYLFETAVRLHRAGEGAPYTGLTEAEVPKEVANVDAALAKGNIAPLADEMAGAVAAGIRQRFEAAAEKRKHDSSVASGREYVEAYVQLVHYVEAVHALANGEAVGHTDAPAHP